MPQINEAISEAEKIYTETPVTDDDIVLLSQLHKPAQRVISRNVSKFNNKVKDISLNAEQAQALNELLDKQKTAIEALWNKIEEGKRNAFQSRSILITLPSLMKIYHSRLDTFPDVFLNN